jgi:glycolate oxidase FAD binding subunit
LKVIEPDTARDLVDCLRSAADARRRIRIGGHFTKHLMAGPNDPEAELTLSTTRLNRVLNYEPRDLTISVEAGIPYRELQATLAANHQMIPFDPIYPDHATIGGIVGANINGPRRRQYGTVRDFVIGMQFAMLNGRLVQSGGMVVKNVAGLDMAKLMIGALGTLAVMTVINFKVFPIPPAERIFAIEFGSVVAAIAARDQVIQGPVPPVAIDLLNPALAAQQGLSGWTLLLRFGGNEALMDRCERLMVTLGPSKTGQMDFWDGIQRLTARFLESNKDGAVVRISCLLDQIGAAMDEIPVPAIARAGTGVIYAYFPQSAEAAEWVRDAHVRGRYALIEFASEAVRAQFDLWPEPGSDFAIMKKIKHLFDPDLLLNRGRLYRHL